LAYLSINRIVGDPRALLGAYHRTEPVMTGVGRDHGLILHAAAGTPDGLLIVNLWPSATASRAAAEDPRRVAVIGEHGLRPAQFRGEHHDVDNYVLFP